jgi:hypothetical protein
MQNLKGKYQVNFLLKDDRGYYDTFLLAQNKHEAETCAKTAKINGAVRIEITDLFPSPLRNIKAILNEKRRTKRNML